MAGDLPELPEGWDTSVPASVWPEALLIAVRKDVRALASPRAQRTLREWQAAARDKGNPSGQVDARRRLAALGAALLGPSPDDEDASLDTALPEVRTSSLRSSGESGETEFTQDSFQLPPRPNLRRTPISQLRETSGVPADDAIVREDKAEIDTDSKVIASRKSSAPLPEAGFEEDDRPTFAFTRPELEPQTPPPSPPQPPPPPPLPFDSQPELRRRRTGADEFPKAPSTRGPPPSAEDDGGPTRHIDIPDELLRRPRPASVSPDSTVPLSSGPPPLKKNDFVLGEDDETHALSADESPALSGSRRGIDVRGDPLSGRLKPKPGIIQRRNTNHRRSHSSSKPRASMQHVRPLYGLLRPFVDELFPLPVERRSRRFWARWREVAGDRGVRREVVEDLLTNAGDVRTMLCELIAEVESADPRSVYALVDKIVASGGVVELARDQLAPISPAERQKKLVGAPVALEDDEDS